MENNPSPPASGVQPKTHGEASAQRVPAPTYQAQQGDLPPSMIYGDSNNRPHYFDMNAAITKAEADGTDQNLIEILKRLDGRLKFIEGVLKHRLGV